MSVQSGNIPSLRTLGDAQDDPIVRTIRAARRRIRTLRLARYLAQWLGYGSAAGLVTVGLSKLRLYAEPSPWSIVGIVAVSLLAGALLALLPRLPDLDVARLTEQRADLKARLTSALEFRSTGHDAEPLYGLQWADAARHAAAVDLRVLYPFRFPRALFFAIPAALALFLLYFLPGLPMFRSAHERAEAEEVKLRGIQMIRLAVDTKRAADQQKLPETKKAAEEVRKLGEAMRNNKISKKQALVTQEKLTRKLEERQKQLARQQAPKSLEQAGKDLKKSMDAVQKEQQKAQVQRAQERQQTKSQPKSGMKPQQASPKQRESDAMKQMKSAMQQMQQSLQQQNPQAMQQAMQKMAQAMQKGGMSKQEMQQMAQMMQQMAQAMQGTQMQLSAQQMQQLAQMMQGATSMDAQQMQAMANMMRQIGNGMGSPSQMAQAAFDARALAGLIGALRAGQLTSFGNGMGRPGYGPGHGGKGYGGTGTPSKAMKDPGATKPKLLVFTADHTTSAQGKNGSITAFQKYLAQPYQASKHLPNAQIKGTRTQNGQELSQQMTGDPGAAQSSTPYYQAVETSRKQAESVLSKENIPATMKKQVHDYFDSIR